MKFLSKIWILIVFLSGTQYLLGQKKVPIDILQSEQLEGGLKDGQKFSKLVGNVKLKHENTIIFCDTAYHFYQKNTMQAIGHVKIIEGDSITITGKKLDYDGNSRLAEFRENVIYKDDSITMYTDYLDYDMPDNMAYYFNGGKIIDSKNVLVSDKGYYDTKLKFSSFKDNAVLTTPEATIESDTLQYDLNTDIAYFKGPTRIVKKDGTKLNANKGKYITKIEKSEIEKGIIENEAQTLEGDLLDFDDINKYYSATGKVKLLSKEDNVTINGDHGKYWANDSITKVYGNALMKKVFDVGDTLYLSADTLISIENTDPSKKRLLAYPNVHIYHKDIQGIADSLAYHISDSVIFFYDDPVIWNGDNQIVADSINIVIRNNQIDRMNMNVNAFVTSKDSLIVKFNQMKGREMIAYFEENEIQKVDVFGNAESIYFAIENDSVLFGMNKIICSDMSIIFKDGEVHDINTYVKPIATLYPTHEIKEPDTRLKDFNWREDEKPTKESVINRTSKKSATSDKKLVKELLEDPGSRE